MPKKPERKRLLTPVFRVSFPDLFTPVAFSEGQPKKYSVTAIIPKKLSGPEAQLLKAMRSAAENACIEKFGEDEYKRLRKHNKLKWPIHDGEEQDLDGYGPDVIYIRLSSQMAPGVIGRRKEALKEDDVYAGCYARARVTVYAYDNISKGVAFGLGNLQKVGEGEAFGSGVAAEDEFDEVDDEIWEDSADVDDIYT